MAVVHASHVGTEGCIRQARECMYWPCMSTELKEYISKCDICLAHRAMPAKEPLLQHEFEGRPWHKISADLCELPGRTLLVVCDYHSNFIEVERIQKINTSGVTKALKPMFARYEAPGVLMSDKGPQFDSKVFAMFAKSWGFEHKTTSPCYPQSNGRAENAVKTVKLLLTKCVSLVSQSTSRYWTGTICQRRELVPAPHSVSWDVGARLCCQCLEHSCTLGMQQKRIARHLRARSNDTSCITTAKPSHSNPSQTG